MFDTISIFLEQHYYWAYLALFILMFIEGEGALMLYGFLSRLGYFNFYVLLFFAIVFIALGDIIWYFLGLKFWKGAKMFVNWKFFFPVYNTLKFGFKNHQKETIFISKFIYGLNHAVIFAAGATKINFKKFLKINISSAIVFAAVFLALGFVLGEGYRAVGKSLRHFSFIVFFTVFAVFSASRVFATIFKKINLF